jgi:hypothetical protein
MRAPSVTAPNVAEVVIATCASHIVLLPRPRCAFLALRAVLFFDNDDLLSRVTALRRQTESLGAGSAAAARARVRAEQMAGSSAREHRVTTADLNDVVAQVCRGANPPLR